MALPLTEILTPTIVGVKIGVFMRKLWHGKH